MDTVNQEHIIQFIKLARQMEMNGLYNAGKLLWAAAFSLEVRWSDPGNQPPDSQALDKDLEAAIEILRAIPGQAALAKALRNARSNIREKRTILQSEIPQVSVCRNCGEAYLGRPPNTCTECGSHSLTFKEFLPIWYLEPLTPSGAIQALSAGIEQIGQLVNGLSDEEMDYYPEPGEWNFREALQHLLVSQELLSGRVEKMLVEVNPSLAGVAAWILDEGAHEPGRLVFKKFNAGRLKLLERMQSLPLESWWRIGVHDEFGQVTILQQASYFAKHERAHLPQVERIRAAILKRRE